MKIRLALNSSLALFFLLTFFQLKTDAQTSKNMLDLDIVYIGNSITEGGQHDAPEKEAPPATSSSYLSTQPGVGIVAFSNQGRSGYTTVDFLPSDPGALKDVISAAHLLHKDRQHKLIFSVSLGTNDSAEKGPNGSPVSPGTYHNNLKSIADTLLSEFPDCKIVLQQPIWYSPNTYNSARYMAEGLARLQTYFPELQSLVKEYSLVNPGHVFMGDVKGFDFFSKNYLSYLLPESGNAGIFYLHPNEKGSAMLGKLWGEAIYNCIIKE